MSRFSIRAFWLGAVSLLSVLAVDLLLAGVVVEVCRRVSFRFGGSEPFALETHSTLVPLIRSK